MNPRLGWSWRGTHREEVGSSATQTARGKTITSISREYKAKRKERRYKPSFVSPSLLTVTSLNVVRDLFCNSLSGSGLFNNQRGRSSNT